jgi:hypothetical protein
VQVLRRTYHRLGNHFDAPDILLGDVSQVKARFGLFRDSVNDGAR